MISNPWHIRRPHLRGPHFLGLEHSAVIATLTLVGLWPFVNAVADIPPAFQLEGKERQRELWTLGGTCLYGTAGGRAQRLMIAPNLQDYKTKCHERRS